MFRYFRKLDEYRFDCMLCRLEPQHRRFVTEFLKDYDPPAAAIRAGYSAKTARQQANRLIRKWRISEAIDAGQRLQDDWARDLAARVRKRLQALGLADLTHLVDDCCRLLPMEDWPAGAAHAVQSVTIKCPPDGSGASTVLQLKLANKVRALAALLDMLTAIEAKAKQKSPEPDIDDVIPDHFMILLLKSMLDRGWLLTTTRGEPYDRAAHNEHWAELISSRKSAP